MTQITFERNTTFQGRNGNFKMSGLTAWRDDNLKVIWLEPITSKNRAANCWMVIPEENLQEFINELEKLK